MENYIKKYRLGYLAEQEGSIIICAWLKDFDSEKEIEEYINNLKINREFTILPFYKKIHPAN